MKKTLALIEITKRTPSENPSIERNDTSTISKSRTIEKIVEGVKKGAKKDLEAISDLVDADTFESLVEELAETVEYELATTLNGIEFKPKYRSREVDF